MQQLDHNHIVKVHGYTTSPVGFYMDFVNGPNLRQFIGGDMEPSDLVLLMLRIGETLQHAHGRNVIHRDVKPENIVLSYDNDESTWVPYLTDFDLAWFSAATQLTKDAMGAIFYAAPEQLATPNSHAAHAPTVDVFSFGQLCFFAATGSDPVPMGVADNHVALGERIGGWTVETSAQRFADLYESCTNHRPSDRPQDFREICDKLFQIHQIMVSVDPSAPISTQRFIRELMYGIVGLAASQSEGLHQVSSLSGRTTITVTSEDEIYGRLNFTVRLFQEDVTMEGLTHEFARRRLNQRVDEALSQSTGVFRRPGQSGGYEVFLDMKNFKPTLEGVDESRRIITRVVDAIEAA